MKLTTQQVLIILALVKQLYVATGIRDILIENIKKEGTNEILLFFFDMFDRLLTDKTNLLQNITDKIGVLEDKS